MEDIYLAIIKALEKREKLALATLVTRVGSAPRAVGAKYLIREDGTSIGSIGGGCVEAEVWQEARGVIESGQGGVLHFSLTAEQLAEGGLICGGNIDIFLEPLKEESLEIYREVAKIRQKGGAAILATLISLDGAFPRDRPSKALFKMPGEKLGSLFDGKELEERVLAEGQEALKEKKPKVIVLKSEESERGHGKTAESWSQVEVLLEPILSEPTVYIFGGGHISQQLSPLAKRVHFKVVVIDDREMFANRERFPEADEVVVSEFKECFDRFPIDDSSYIVIVTRGHLCDGFVLEQAVRTNARYIGMIGSKKKIQTLYHDLMAKGVPKEVLDRVHAPIGIDIHSETPEEIAVSIVAELIKVRGEMSNPFGSDRNEQIG
ncbi:MAG: XdhC family aldehyde oxidoreductase maturation factor [Thermodesulfobacteriota bacterium]